MPSRRSRRSGRSSTRRRASRSRWARRGATHKEEDEAAEGPGHRAARAHRRREEERRRRARQGRRGPRPRAGAAGGARPRGAARGRRRRRGGGGEVTSIGGFGSLAVVRSSVWGRGSAPPLARRSPQRSVVPGRPVLPLGPLDRASVRLRRRAPGRAKRARRPGAVWRRVSVPFGAFPDARFWGQTLAEIAKKPVPLALPGAAAYISGSRCALGHPASAPEDGRMKLIVLALAAGTAVAECPNVSSSVATKAGQRKAAARERPARGSPRPAGGSPRHPRTCPKTRSHEKPRPRLCAHRSCRAGRRRTHKTHKPHERGTARRERAERDPQTTQACSGHGTCGTFDECICYPNWQEADCSGRTCPFVPAHVDTPKGDLDGSADALSGTGTTVIAGSTVYPHGTTEQYPLMVDSAGGSLTNTGHAYAECGNKGICDRKSGECDCFPGYSGAGCQKAACGDATCSGHGVCMSAQDLAAADHGNVYNLWDSEVTMGCKCEPGYSGPTCESKMCKHGLDPLYIDDDYMTIRAPTARVLLQYVNVTGRLEAMRRPRQRRRRRQREHGPLHHGHLRHQVLRRLRRGLPDGPARGDRGLHRDQGRARVHGERHRPRGLRDLHGDRGPPASEASTRGTRSSTTSSSRRTSATSSPSRSTRIWTARGPRSTPSATRAPTTR